MAVEFGHCLRILHEVGDVTELKRAGAEHLVVGAEVLPFVEELNRGAFGIVEGQHLADARNDIAAASPFLRSYWEAARAEGPNLGVVLDSFEVQESRQFESTFDAMKAAHAGALIV